MEILNGAKEELHHFSLTSRVEVNYHKSTTIWASLVEK
jgi:hypothetical protein